MNLGFLKFHLCNLSLDVSFLVERQDERITEMKREYHMLHERHSEVRSGFSCFFFFVAVGEQCNVAKHR